MGHRVKSQPFDRLRAGSQETGDRRQETEVGSQRSEKREFQADLLRIT